MTQFTHQFDALGSTYEELSHTPFRRYLEAPSVFSALGDIAGKAVIDLGCGAGDYTRWLRERGAGRVVGYDVSAGMIAHARAREQREPLGIEYFEEELPSHLWASFDIVLSVYVMPYATSRGELLETCLLARRLLRAGGRYITLPIHPDFPHNEPDYYLPYGFRMFTDGTPSDQSAVTLELLFGGHHDIITARYWSRETLNAVLIEAGLSQAVWRRHHVSPEGITALGEQYFQPYLTQPHAALLSVEQTTAMR